MNVRGKLKELLGRQSVKPQPKPQPKQQAQPRVQVMPPEAKLEQNLDKIAKLFQRIAQKELLESKDHRQQLTETLGGILTILETAAAPSENAENPLDQITDALARMEVQSESRHDLLLASLNALTASLNNLVEEVAHLRSSV